MADVETAPRADRDSSDRQIASGVRDVVVAAPLFITAPLYPPLAPTLGRHRRRGRRGDARR